MTESLLTFSLPFSATKNKKGVISLLLLQESSFKDWLKKQKKPVQDYIALHNFTAKTKQVLCLYNTKGQVETILCGLSTPAHYLDSAALFQFIQNQFSAKFIKDHIFELTSSHNRLEQEKIFMGWGLAAYTYHDYKKSEKSVPVLLWPDKEEQQEVITTVQAISLLRDLINTPPNVLGTDELAQAAKTIAVHHKAKIEIIKGAPLKKGFPLIHAVGKASPRPPQLVDITWGKAKDPKITLVGKGIVYDTGGLDIKPPQFMRDMKKDMGGAAHTLALAWIIMSLRLPVRLRVLLPIAENSVSGESFRPGDVITSRKGLHVEIDDTDAEGRLVVADTLAYACEDKPDLLIDYCTLTGAARVALGYDIPAFFSNQDSLLDILRYSSVASDDPIWPLPLWHGYEKEMDSSVADLINSGSGRAGAIHGGLFLQRFIDPSVDWIHLDCYAWEQYGKAGRPKGGADTGLRAIADFIKERYA